MAAPHFTAIITDIPVHEITRSFDHSIMRSNYVDTLLELIVEAAEEIEPAPKHGAPERIRILAEIAQLVNTTAIEELMNGERYIRDHQTTRLAA